MLEDHVVSAVLLVSAVMEILPTEAEVETKARDVLPDSRLRGQQRLNIIRSQAYS